MTGISSAFEIIERPNGFSLAWAASPSTPVMTVWIGRLTMGYELAVDAACEFMDRFTTAYADGISADALMHSCVVNAQNQN